MCDLQKIRSICSTNHSFGFETQHEKSVTLEQHIQLGQLRLNPPGLGSKCGKWVGRLSDFGKYKGNFRNHTTSLPIYRTFSKWGKWVDRLSDFGNINDILEITQPLYPLTV